jgi:hypothetical protein
VILLDAAGREAKRYANRPSGPVPFDRDGLSPGVYHCILVEGEEGAMHRLGQVIAQ